MVRRAAPEYIEVRVRWSDEPCRTSSRRARPHVQLVHVLDALWLDHCIRERQGWYKDMGIQPAGATVRVVRDLPPYVATRNDADGLVNPHTPLSEAGITPETWFALAPADASEQEAQ